MIIIDRIAELLRNGEGLGIEFKRCSGKIEHDVFETICAFLNRFGGDILLGVENDGTVVGVKDYLIHREFTSSRPARFVIERERMFVENACRATNGERVTPSNIEPDPKNPIVAAFFREIAYADQLGSGVKNLYKYAKAYGGDDPVFQDGDMFTISVSLEKIKDLMPFLPNDPEVAQIPPAVTPAVPPAVAEVAQKGAEVAQKRDQVAQKGTEVAPISGQVAPKSSEVAPISGQVAPKSSEVAPILEQVAQKLQGKGRSDAITNAISVFAIIIENAECSVDVISERTKLAKRSVKNAVRLLRENGVLRRDGGTHGGKWIVQI